jgi:predicted ribosomally synthesized peptide with SipW-like signal peptide
MKKILISISTIAIVAVVAVTATRAYFNSTVTSTGNTFSAGTLALDGPGITTFNVGDIPNMAPGDKTGTASITIKNDGTMPLVWLGKWVITGNSTLKQAIYIDSATMEFLGKNGNPGGWSPAEPTDNFITSGRGSGSYPDWFNTLADLSPFKVVTLNNWDGNNGMGTAPYEHVGALNPGYAYRLTVRFGFAKDAGNDYQGKGPLTVSFKADATQTNPDALAKLTSWSDWAWINSQLVKQP